MRRAISLYIDQQAIDIIKTKPNVPTFYVDQYRYCAIIIC